MELVVLRTHLQPKYDLNDWKVEGCFELFMVSSLVYST